MLKKQASILITFLCLFMIMLNTSAIFANDPPKFQVIGDWDVDEGEHLMLRIRATDPEQEPLIMWATNLPQNATFVDSGEGIGGFTFNPSYEQADTYYVTFFVSDPGGLSDTEEVEIRVKDIDPWAPVIDSIGHRHVNEGMILSFLVTATPSDSNPNPDTLILSAYNLPLNAEFEDSGNGTGLFTFEPNHAQSGTYYVTFKVSDGVLADSEVVEITVFDVAMIYFNDTTAYTGQKEAKISVFLQTEQPVGGFSLLFYPSRPDKVDFTTDRVEFSPDTVRFCKLDTVGSAVSYFDELEATGPVGNPFLPECNSVSIMGIADYVDPPTPPLPAGQHFLFRLVLDFECWSFNDTLDPPGILYLYVEGELTDSSGNERIAVDLSIYGSITLLPAICGDVNADQKIQIADVIYLANYLIKGGPPPCPIEAGYIDADDRITIADAIIIANYLFKGIEAGCFGP